MQYANKMSVTSAIGRNPPPCMLSSSKLMPLAEFFPDLHVKGISPKVPMAVAMSSSDIGRFVAGEMTLFVSALAAIFRPSESTHSMVRTSGDPLP